ncbi:MAG: hypothetical protein ABI743_02360 [bacterium]
MAGPFGGWALGSYTQRLAGGIPGLIFGDTVVPWTSSENATSGPLDPPMGAPPNPYEGFHRNMQLDPDVYFPNFPHAGDPPLPELGFNVVVVNVGMLQQSGTAPPVLGMKGERTEGLDEWPLNAQLLVDFLKYYIETFLEEHTYLIVVFPEREIRQIFDATSHGAPWSGSRENGEQAIRDIMDAMIGEDATWRDRILGWVLADEPEINDRTKYLAPEHLAELRLFIRSYEKEIRGRVDESFKTLPPAIQNAMLRPTILFMAAAPFDPMASDLRQAREFRECADIFTFDDYCIRQTPSQLLADPLVPAAWLDEPQWVNAEAVNQYWALPEFLFERALQFFIQLRDQVNTDSCGVLHRFGSEGYKPVWNWIQANGGPWPKHVTSSTDQWTKTPSTDPQFLPDDYLPDPPVDGGPYQIYFARTRRLPTRPTIRTYTWASLSYFSEAMPCWAQPGLPNQWLVSEYVPVALEIQYFQSLRYTMRIRRDLFRGRSYITGAPSAGALVRPGFALIEFPTPPTKTGWTSIPNELWLLCINPTRAFVDVRLSFVMADRTPGPGGSAGLDAYYGTPAEFRLYDCFEPGNTLDIVRGLFDVGSGEQRGEAPVRMFPGTMQLYRWQPLGTTP